MFYIHNALLELAYGELLLSKGEVDFCFQLLDSFIQWCLNLREALLRIIYSSILFSTV